MFTIHFQRTKNLCTTRNLCSLNVRGLSCMNLLDNELLVLNKNKTKRKLVKN